MTDSAAEQDGLEVERPSRAAGIVGFAGPDELAPHERQEGRRGISLDQRSDLFRRERRSADGGGLGYGAVAFV